MAGKVIRVDSSTFIYVRGSVEKCASSCSGTISYSYEIKN